MSLDLWPQDIMNRTFEKNRAMDILREQADLIDQKTNGKIKAAFSEIEYEEPGSIPSWVSLAMTGVLTGLQKTSAKPAEEERKAEILETELENKKNINSLYKKDSYKFEIYNEEFRFRILVLKNSIEFPIEIIVDEGIREELHLDKKKIIESNGELERFLSRVFSCKKVRLILSRMLCSNEEAEEK